MQKTAYQYHFFLVSLILTFAEAEAGSFFGVSCPNSLKWANNFVRDSKNSPHRPHVPFFGFVFSIALLSVVAVLSLRLRAATILLSFLNSN